MAQIQLEKKTYTINEAAKVLGISRSHTYKMLSEGKIPAIRLGTKTVIPIAALDRWLEEQVQKAQ